MIQVPQFHSDLFCHCDVQALYFKGVDDETLCCRITGFCEIIQMKTRTIMFSLPGENLYLLMPLSLHLSGKMTKKKRWAEVLLTKCGPDAGHRDMEWTNHRQRRFKSMFTLPLRIWQLKDNLATIAVLINGHLRLLSNLSASRAASAPDVAHISTLSRLFTVTCAGNDFWRDFAEAHLLT